MTPKLPNNDLKLPKMTVKWPKTITKLPNIDLIRPKMTPKLPKNGFIGTV